MPAPLDTPLSLLERVKNGDEDAWSAFASRYVDVLKRWCQGWNISATDSEDVIQDALLAILLSIPKFERQRVGSFRRWIKTIAWRCWCDAMSKSERLQYSDLLHKLRSPAAHQELEREFDRVAVEEILHTAIERVRVRVQEQTWEAFRLTALDEQPAAQVAEILYMSIDAIYAARCRVQKLITQEFNRLDRA